ncbi:metal-dependent hydrolase family protein [Microbacterium sp.]|uniref:metal-dependent hydrolase family protein n=1 Tax=Microbacterium sp. TaxID=51671 RepID=UPI002810EDE9|nr:amidohydrolase family protein [Microbacterium sp.]
MVQTASLVIAGARVWQGLGKGFAERDLVIVDGRVSDRAGVETDVIDATGKWIVPGLIDAHFHAYAYGVDQFQNERGPLSYAAVKGAERLGAALRRGFTTVRDVAGGDIGLKRAVDRDVFASPRYLFTGPALSQTGGHGDPRSEHVDVCFGHGHMCDVVDGVDALRLAVRNRLRTGAHAIKVMTSGGVFSLTDPVRVPQYSADELRAVCDEAARRGTYVTAHSYSSESVMHSIENGVRCIEHGNLIDAETAAEMARRGVSLVPTLVTYDAMGRRGAELGLNSISLAKNQEVLTKGKEAAATALAAGVRVGFGTDLMGDMEDEQLHGVRLQVDSLGAEQALHSMTMANAEILGDTAIGHLGIGAHGDAVILDGNPLEDFSVVWAEDAQRTVVQGGAVIG